MIALSLPDPTAPTGARPSYARRRALALVLVHVAFAAHIVHWKLAGRTLAPLELNELMYTLEAGIVTAGFLFMLLVCLSVLVFGRFFCSWGCHVLALQDLCSWIMEKLGVRPRVVRMRGLLWVPLVAMLYMFVWPQLEFLFLDRPRPVLRVTGDESGWASFVTSDYWRNLPPVGGAIATLFVCGFAFVYLMGHRSFCKYACPYGAIFALLDRLAPGRIAKTGDCSACGLCTAACTSDIRVHEELATYGQVVDSACLKDLDCLNACPDAAIGFRFRKPALFRDRSLEPPKPKKRMFSGAEEWAMVVGFLFAFLVLRGLYGKIPLLMSLALAGMLVYLGVVCVRLLRTDSVKLVRAQLKSRGRWKPAGVMVFSIGSLLAALLAHSAVVRVQAWRGQRSVEALGWKSSAPGVGDGLSLEYLDRYGSRPIQGAGPGLAGIEAGIAAWEFVDRYGLGATPGTQRGLGALHAARADHLAQAGNFEQAVADFERAVAFNPRSAPLRYNLARLLSQVGRSGPAIEHLRVAAELAPEDADVANNLGFLLMERGERQAAEVEMRRAIELRPDFAPPWFNLGRLLFESGAGAEALPHFERAAQLDPLYAEWFAEFRGENGQE